MRMKSRILLIITLLLLSGCSSTPSYVPVASPVGLKKEIAWDASFENARKAAQAQRKPLMIDFYADWCKFCKEMDEKTYSDSQVQHAAEDFISVKVNTDHRPDLA